MIECCGVKTDDRYCRFCGKKLKDESTVLMEIAYHIQSFNLKIAKKSLERSIRQAILDTDCIRIRKDIVKLRKKIEKYEKWITELHSADRKINQQPNGE